jgi:hypothetical protein
VTIPIGTIRCSLRGTLPQGEQFNTSFWLADSPIVTGAQTQDAAALIATAWNTTGGPAVGATFSVGTRVDEVRLYAYPFGGPTATFIAAAPVTAGVGVATTNLLPLQTCLVVSLLSAFAGRTKRGRMYVPLTSNALVAHQTNVTPPNIIATGMKGFFDALNAQSGSLGKVSVVSQKGAGGSVPVRSLKIDSRCDIQRRHANRQVATTNFTATLAP